MTTFYADTSALIKRYITEDGSEWMRKQVRISSGNVVIICDVTPVEIFSVLARLNREGRLSSTRLGRFQNIFLAHAEREYLIIPVNGHIFAQARLLVSRHKLRALDALHLASAQSASTILGETITFLTSDVDLKAAAVEEGFVTDDPLQHI